MISEALINLSIVGLACLLLVFYLIKFVFRYKHEYESNPLCTLTVVFCLFVVLLTTFVLPVDIFLVSFIKEPDGIFKTWATNETLATIDKAVFATYYSLYGVTLILIFVVIPFLHFFNEESESNSRDRLHNAIKYTFGFILLVTLLLLVGALIHTEDVKPNTVFDKVIPTANVTRLQSAITMVLTVIITAGFINVTFYTASGIFSWPIGLILGTSSVSSRYDAVSDRSDLLRVRVNNLRDKARIDQLSQREQQQLDAAEEELRQLDREETVLFGYSASWSYKLRRAIRPIQIIIGLLFGALSLLLLATLIIVNIDRVLHSAGPKEGYILLKPQIFNPLEYVYTKTQNLIFIGPIPLLIVICFLVVATISGVRNLGLWFMFARLHHVKVARTPPQALLFFCITIMLAATAFNLILYSMTSQYITFGNQNHVLPGANGTMISMPCTIDNYHQDCILTRSSVILMRMMSQIWIFGAIFYWWSWAFVAIGSVSLLAYLKRGKRQAVHDIMTDEDEFEE